MPIAGGFTDAKPADADIQNIVDGVKHKLAAHGGKSSYQKFNAVSYKSQVVAGTNFHIKVDAGDEHIHIKVFRPLPCNGTELELKSVEFNKTKEDQLI